MYSYLSQRIIIYVYVLYIYTRVLCICHYILYSGHRFTYIYNILYIYKYVCVRYLHTHLAASEKRMYTSICIYMYVTVCMYICT